MSYSLTLDTDGRILCATFPEYNPDGVMVESLPDGDVSDYRYVDGEFISDPLPEEAETVDEVTLLKAQVQALSDRNDFLEDCVAEMAGIVYA